MDQRRVPDARLVRPPLTRHPDLPSDFLSTPFGAALRPTIDAMFRRPTGLTPPAAPGQQPSPALASSLLQGVADRATAPRVALDSGYATPSTSTVAGAIHVSTNPASFRSLLDSHRAVVAMFTSATCGPCRMIEPVFEDLAHANSRGRGQGKVAFAKVDLGVGMGGAIARQYNVSATPTFGFFLDGKRVCFGLVLLESDDDNENARRFTS
jgi:thiol-disulfide isomerase/thioredoxin